MKQVRHLVNTNLKAQRAQARQLLGPNHAKQLYLVQQLVFYEAHMQYLKSSSTPMSMTPPDQAEKWPQSAGIRQA